MLKFKLSTCQEVATFASDYLDNHANGRLAFNIRMHLMLCANCRRFVKHLKLTKEVVPQFAHHNEQQSVDAEAILRKIKLWNKNPE
jgi:predicted anti-sigma-YlaC factor YlaD